MLESYFVKPQTTDRVRASWIGPGGRALRRMAGRARVLARGACSAGCRCCGIQRVRAALVEASVVEDLAGYVEGSSLRGSLGYRGVRRGGNVETDRQIAREVRGPIEQILRLVVARFLGSGRRHRCDPFADALPGFFDYLVFERGIRPATIRQYRYHLWRFEAYLDRIGVRRLSELAPMLLSAFVAELAGAGLSKETVGVACGMLRVLLRYAHREGAISRDLAGG